MVAFSGKKRYDKILLFLALILFKVPFGYASKVDNLQKQIKENQNKLKKIDSLIIKRKGKLKGLRDDQKKILKKIETFDQNIERYKYKVKVYDDKIDMNRLKLRQLEDESDQLQNLTSQKQKLLASRLRAWYKIGTFGVWRIIFSSDSFLDLSQKIKYIRLVAGDDAHSIFGLSDQIKKIRKKKEEIVLVQQKIKKLKQKVIKESKLWKQKKREKEQYLALLKNEQKERQTTIRGLVQRQNEIQKIIKKLERKSYQRFSSNFSSKKGALLWPTQGIISASFGKKSGKAYEKNLNRNKGIVIQVPEGGEICSIYKGRVLYADWCCGYGKLVIIDHGGGYCSIYAHLSDLLVKAKDTVKEGQLFGFAGNTGAVRESQLYFEIRFRGLPIDPIPWLQ